LLNQSGVVFLYKSVEQSLLWAMAFVGPSRGSDDPSPSMSI